jgi:RimJ/RimL family protein N-acetyltransferase
MQNFRKKLFLSFQLRGSINTFLTCGNTFLDWCGLRLSETFFFKRSLTDNLESIKISNSGIVSENNFVVIKDDKDLKLYNNIPKKFGLLPYTEWFSRNAMCLALEFDRNIIAYSWVHLDYYDNLGLAGTFRLDAKEAWIGSAYIDIDFRKKGLSYFFLFQRLKYIKNLGIEDVYTSTNSKNLAPIRYLTKSGFRLIGCVRAKRYQDRVILDFTQEQFLKKKIT